MPRTPPIAVVGSDLDALTAGFRLRQSGRRVLWFPRTETASGPQSFDDRRESAPSRAPVPESAPFLMALAAELGIGKSVRRSSTPPLTFVLPARPTLTWPGWTSIRGRTASIGMDSGSTGAQPLRRGVRGPLARRRVRRLLRWYAPWTDPHAPERGTRLDDRSVADWTHLYLGRTNLDQLYGPCLAHAFGLDPHETSRLLLLPLLDAHGRPRLERVEGCDELRIRLEAALSDARQSAPVRAIEGGGTRIRLASGRSRNAQATVLAVSMREVAELEPALSPAELQALEDAQDRHQVQLTFTTSALASTAEPPLGARAAARSTTFWISLSLPGPLAAIEVTRSEDASQHRVTLIGRAALAARAATLRDAELIDTLVYAASAHLPALAPHAQARASDLVLWRGRHTGPSFRVGHFRAVERMYRESERLRERKLFLCGAYQIAPHDEGAVTAGERAAGRCLERLATS